MHHTLFESQKVALAAGLARLRSMLGALAPREDMVEAAAPLLPAALAPDTALMDSCRALLVTISRGRPNVPPLLVTGPAPQRHVELTAAGLAVALAESGRKTLLIDADIRFGALHELFRLAVAPGLSEVLEADQQDELPPLAARIWSDDPDESIAPLVRDRLRVLPAGLRTRSVTDLLRSPALPRLAQALAEQFEAVVYQHTGSRTHPDTLLLAPHVGAAVLTLTSGVTSSDDARRTKELLERSGAQLLGFAFLDGE